MTKILKLAKRCQKLGARKVVMGMPYRLKHLIMETSIQLLEKK